MTTSGVGYEPGDVNVADGAGADDGVDGEELVYEAGDVNTVTGSSPAAGGGFDDDGSDDDDDDDEDVGSGGEGEGGADDGFDDYDDDEVDGGGGGGFDGDGEIDGNRASSGMPTAVLTYLARALVSEPDAVVVLTEERRGSVVLRLHVAPEDMGRVIGRRGRTAQAIRTLVGVAGARDGVETSVDIVDA